MPEVTWTYRRWFAYGRTLLFSAMVVALSFQVRDEDTKRMVLRGLLALLTADAVLYMVGPTATDLVRIFKGGLSARRSSRTLP